MIRIFTHYVSSKTLLLITLEVLVLSLVAFAGMYLHSAVEGKAIAIGVEAAIFPAAIILCMSSVGAYQLDLWDDLRTVAVRILIAIPVGFALLIPMIHYWDSTDLGWDLMATMFMVALGGTLMARYAVHKMGSRNALRERVLVLGTGSRVVRLEKYSHRNRNHEIVGYVALRSAQHFAPLSKVLHLAPGESLSALADKHGVTRIVNAVRERRGGALPINDLLECRLRGIKVTELSTFFEREYRQMMLETINPSWFVFGDGFRSGFFRSAMKRAFDIVVSAILLILALPVMVVTALCIVIESGRPVFFGQERVGQGGLRFLIHKFRSMGCDAERDGTPQWAAVNDDRTTGVGRVIRKLRIDELPQLINVLKGDMSFVGPRPERPYFVDKLSAQIPYYRLRHAVKPGITGWAQVNCAYGASLDDTIEKLQYDLYYLKNHGLFLDLVILLATVEVVLWGKGAR